MSVAYDQDILVKYGSFTFPAPTPFVSRSYKTQLVGGDIWATTVETTLTGQIAILPKRESVEGNNYSALAGKRNQIATAFAGALGKNFQTLTVYGHGTNFILEGCSVTNLSFSSSPHRGLVDYTISLSGYDSSNDFISANFGVVNPVDTWAYSDAGGTASLTHTVSAQGYNTSSDYKSFLNAKAFVDSRKGTSSKIPSFLINNAHPGSALILNSKSEQINRLGGSFGVTENYSFATNESSEAAGLETAVPIMQTANILLTYTLSINEQQGGDFVGVTLSGNVIGSKLDDADYPDEEGANTTTWDEIKEDFKSRNFYDLANQAYENYIQRLNGGNNKSLNKDPIIFSISPNEHARTIGFNLTFDNNDLFEKAKIKRGKAYFDYNISFQHDNITDIINVQCNGTIKSRSALRKRNKEAKDLLDEDILKDNSAVIREEAQELYWKMYPSRTKYFLSPKPTSESVTQNEFNGTITYAASFSDKDFPEDSELESLAYSIQIDPATQIYKPVPSCQANGHYIIYDLNLKSKREMVNISVNANPHSKNEKALSEAWDETYSTSDFLKNSFLELDEEGDDDKAVVRLDSENKVENKDTGAITYTRGFSQEKPAETITLERKNPS